MSKKNNPKSRIWSIELYPENDKHNEILSKLYNGYNFIGVLHDRDIYEDDNEELGHKKGDLKKPHYHIILKFENARYKSALSNELELEENLIQKLSSYKSYLIYMTHRDYPQKAQYDIEEFFGSLKLEAIKELGTNSESNQFFEILNYIKFQNKYIKFQDISEFVFQYGYYSTYRRAFPIIKEHIIEHNAEYIKQQYERSENYGKR